jgi:Ran GTPase-activating protein (RanGAP) involved in mRNA processing and transport
MEVLLQDNELTSQGASTFVETLNNNSTLQGLFIQENRVLDSDVRSHAKTLESNNDTLKRLGLQPNAIIDSSAEDLARMLKTNQSLTALYISRSKITD